MLSRAERARARGFRSPQAGLQFVAGRFLARSSLSLYRSVPPRAWRFKLNDHGRPEVDWPRAGHGLSFNISHTNGLAAVAVTSGCEIGLDVERIDRCVDFAGVAASVFTPRETDDVLLREPDGVAERFFDLWTLKEAYIKARGLGFSLSPASFEVPRGDAGIALRCMPECDPSPGRWQFHLSTHDGVRMAVAVGSRSVRCIRLFECAPPGRARSFFLRELSP
ncbi:MAG: 4'-phosphopantetheinyl transferase superfamily protein [Hyphomicrobiaceae bacterium]|nr:4'-phosphopantetheinyl transferase superfamily protein [Hyphomicrobiaceae bacterium]